MLPVSYLLAVATLLPAGNPVAAPPSRALEAATEYTASHGGQAMIVVFDGETVFEHYDHGGAADRPQGLASGCKSFVGVAAVAAVQDGLIRPDDPVSESITEWQQDPTKATITYRQLLNMTSGLTRTTTGNAATAPAWKEQAAKPMAARPGERFEYGASHLNVFAYALERKLSPESFENYLQRRILDRIGVKVEWRLRCDDGQPWVGGGAFMTGRDWATFGEFVRRGGNWKGQQILDANLLRECFVGTRQNPAYGLTWWLKAPVSNDLLRDIPLLSEWGDVANSDWLPGDLVAAFGGGKQRLYLIPSFKLVIVRQGSQSQGFSEVEFLSLLLRGKSNR
ncbi:MAG TPA: serine hydrolase [Pirellulales bacterium]|jgi:CubicO group peptidase (beta-lactamase class C family)|nr:serine hydrolase [Pirellulales bacterium]